jgi:hypothetical protein
MTRLAKSCRPPKATTPPLVEMEDLDPLLGKINDAHDRVEKAFQSCIELGFEAGLLLQEVKDKLKHGKFEAWVEGNCNFSARTARVYLRLASELPKLDDANRQRAADLSLRGVLKLLANPKTEVVASPPRPRPSLPEGSDISLADMDVAELLAELEARGQAAAEEGLLQLLRKWADDGSMEVIIKPKAPPTTTDTSAPAPEDNLLDRPSFLGARAEAVG